MSFLKAESLPFILNLSNSIMGVSLLTLPLCIKECGLILGALLLLLSASLAQLSSVLLLNTATIMKKRSYEFLVLKLFGFHGKLLVEISTIGLLLGSSIALFVIIGDLGPAIISKSLSIENNHYLRSSLLLIVGLFIVIPLSLKSTLERISKLSALALIFYIIVLIQILYASIPILLYSEWIFEINYWNFYGIFKSFPIFALSYACQIQLFVIYHSLPEASTKQIEYILNNAIVFCTFVYFFIGHFGYIAFYQKELTGDILLSFEPTIMCDLIKSGFLISTILSFPLIIFPCRSSIYTLCFVNESLLDENNEKFQDNIMGTIHIPINHYKYITIIIVIVTLTIGIFIPQVEFIIGITGSTLGSIVCFIMPSVMYIKADTQNINSIRRVIAQGIFVIGIALLIVSTFVTLYGFSDKDNISKFLNNIDYSYEHKILEEINTLPWKLRKMNNLFENHGANIESSPKFNRSNLNEKLIFHKNSAEMIINNSTFANPITLNNKLKM